MVLRGKFYTGPSKVYPGLKHNIVGWPGCGYTNGHVYTYIGANLLLDFPHTNTPNNITSIDHRFQIDWNSCCLLCVCVCATCCQRKALLKTRRGSVFLVHMLRSLNISCSSNTLCLYNYVVCRFHEQSRV